MEAKRHMTIINIPILTYTDPENIKKVFEETYLKNTLVFEDIDLVIFPEDFKHICYENGKDKAYKEKLSLRRSRKLLLIREICKNKIPYILIHQINRENKSICVLAEAAEFAMYLIPQFSKDRPYLRLGTIISYGEKVQSKIKKQKQQGVIIKSINEALKKEAD